MNRSATTRNNSRSLASCVRRGALGLLAAPLALIAFGCPPGYAQDIAPALFMPQTETLRALGDVSAGPAIETFESSAVAHAFFETADGDFNAAQAIATEPHWQPREIVQACFLGDSAVIEIPPLAPPEMLPLPSAASGFSAPVNPPPLRGPATRDFVDAEEIESAVPDFVEWTPRAPLGFTGPSGILPTEDQADGHFVPAEDRWRAGFDDWDRYDQQHPLGKDYPYKKGHWWDPYNQNVLKGDYPFMGQHIFANVTLANITFLEGRQVPTPTTPFESTLRPFQEEFFGDPNQFAFTNPLKLSVEVFRGDAGFKPMDWKLKIGPVLNANFLGVEELAIVNPDVRRGTRRPRGDFALEEWFGEIKLADLSPHYDFVSLRAGSQPFVSDFRGFIFNDVNRGVRVFGTASANREQFNLIWLDQTEKDTNSALNTIDDRDQNTVIANYFRQDFIWPGYTAELSYHLNHDGSSFKFDDNDFLVRPDPVGVFRPHTIDAHYLGWAGDGHINRINVSHAFYWALGTDSLNPLAGSKQEINAQMFALELSYDRDWVRFRSSFFWASGDDNPNDDQARGFDAIFDNPNFAGGEFSFWQRQGIKLFGVNLTNAGSLLPNLRSSKIQGQTNFVNPGLYLFNLGLDADVTPKLKLISNANVLWFDETQVLETFVFQSDIERQLGYDLSLGAEYRPLLNDNLQFIGGVAGFIPESGFKDIYNPLRGETPALFAGFVQMVAVY